MKKFSSGLQRGDRVWVCAPHSVFYKVEFLIYDFDNKNNKILCTVGQSTPFAFTREELKRVVVDARENPK